MKTPDKHSKPSAIDDRKFGTHLRQRLPDAPPQPMFTRMVMNRLTHRSTLIATFIEYTLYIIGIATTGVVATNLGIKYFKSPMVSEVQLTGLITLILVFFCLLYALISPFVGERR